MFPLNSDLGTVVMSCGMAFFSWDLGSDKVYGDVALAGLLGVEAAMLASGLPILAIIERISLDDRARVAASIHRAITGGELYQERYGIERGAGRRVEVISVGRCLKDTAGVPFIYNGTMMEIGADPKPEGGNPLESHCRSALDLAERQGNELAARYLSSALRVIGAA